MAGLYIHIPFCKQLCNYCGFHFSMSLSKKEDMLKAIKKEMEIRKCYTEKKIDTLYIGGGTPSVCSVEEIQQLINHAVKVFDIEMLRETTIEVNPEDLTKEYIDELAKSTVDRVSIGIQSLNNDILKMMNRRHDASQAVKAVKELQYKGMENISIDMMYGIPGMSCEKWEEEITMAINLNTKHISAYHLTIEPKTVLYNKMKRGLANLEIDETISTKQYEILENATNSNGYQHYEVSNFAKDGYKAIHNSSYWDGTPYIGVGPSAHSFDGMSRQWNIFNNLYYIEKINNSQKYYEKETLSLCDRYNEYIMLSLRTYKGIDCNMVKDSFGTKYFDYMMQKADKLIASGKILFVNGKMIIESRNFLVSDYIISELFF